VDPESDTAIARKIGMREMVKSIAQVLRLVKRRLNSDFTNSK
jgi:hypothetical protein